MFVKLFQKFDIFAIVTLRWGGQKVLLIEKEQLNSVKSQDEEEQETDKYLKTSDSAVTLPSCRNF